MMIWTFSWYRQTGEIGPQELAARIAHLFVHGFAAQGPAVGVAPVHQPPAGRSKAA